MDEYKLNVELREAGNGWVVSFTKYDETVEYIFSRPGPALSMVKRVMLGEEKVFKGDADDE